MRAARPAAMLLAAEGSEPYARPFTFSSLLLSSSKIVAAGISSVVRFRRRSLTGYGKSNISMKCR